MRGGFLPMASRPTARIAAVTPEPQLVITGLSRSTPAFVEFLRDLFRRGQAAVLDQSVDRHAVRARHMAGAQAGARLGLASPRKRLAGRASTTWALLIIERHLHVADMATTPVFSSALNMRGGRWTVPGFERPAFRLPLRQAAIEDDRPCSRRRCGTSTRPAARRKGRRRHRRRSFILADAESPDSLANSSGPGSMCGRSVEWSAMASMSKNTAPGIWPASVLRLGVALLRRQVAGAVDDGDVRLAEVRGEPFGGLEPAACCSAAFMDPASRYQCAQSSNRSVKATRRAPAARGGSACPSSRSA